MNYRFAILSVSVCTSLFFMQHVFSQTSSFDPSSLINPNTGLPIGIDEQVSLEQIPKIPKPGELVSIRINAYTTNLNKAKITWTQDGKIILSQTGAVSNQVQAPQSGKSSTLIITIQKEGGGTITKTVTLNPADVDLFYEAQTYAHPFFKGKKQFTSEAVITFVAVPNFVTTSGKKFADSELVYMWKINGTTQQEISGYGRNTFTTKGQLIERPSQITVEVSAINSNLTATQSLNIRSIMPEMVIYENNPLLGIIYEKAISGSFFLERPQVDFEGVPYFFSANTKDSNSLGYKWSVNGTQITSKNPTENYLLLRNDKNEEGRAIISAAVTHTQNILQTTGAQLELNFKKIENTSNEAVTF